MLIWSITLRDVPKRMRWKKSLSFVSCTSTRMYSPPEVLALTSTRLVLSSRLSWLPSLSMMSVMVTASPSSTVTSPSSTSLLALSLSMHLMAQSKRTYLLFSVIVSRPLCRKCSNFNRHGQKNIRLFSCPSDECRALELGCWQRVNGTEVYAHGYYFYSPLSALPMLTSVLPLTSALLPPP